nr:MAG TPA: anaerobic ribonucleoside-triphosphate reductase activating protein [Caudoviricetes sp.]
MRGVDEGHGVLPPGRVLQHRQERRVRRAHPLHREGEREGVSDSRDLQVAGLVPLSSVDWPGRLVATVFCQGCPLRCPYCQNSAILDNRTPGVIAWSEVEGFLKRRRGLLDGVVFTGGEALRQEAVIPAAESASDLGFGIGVHTSGMFPDRLESMMHVVDWVGLDVKARPEDYKKVVGVRGDKVWKTLDLVLESGVEYEVRTTVYPESLIDYHFEDFVSQLKLAGVRTFALQEARTEGTPVAFQLMAASWDRKRWGKRRRELVECVQVAGFDRYILRLV